MRRTALGLLAILFLLGGVALPAFGSGQSSEVALGSSGLRIGLVLGAFWLAYPQISYVPWWLVQAILIGAVVVAVRPKTAVFVLPMLLALWIVRPRKKKNSPARRSPTRPRQRKV